jgi:hypothetical protein
MSQLTVARQLRKNSWRTTRYNTRLLTSTSLREYLSLKGTAKPTVPSSAGSGTVKETSLGEGRIRTHSWILQYSIYEVEFDSGETEAYNTNIIAESIYSQVDDDGYTTFALKEIIDHRTDGSALTLDDAYTVTKTGAKRLQQTTKGWQLCVRWNDESTSWVALKDLKDSNPIKVAEYAVNMKIASEPAFAWWVPHTLKKRHRMIKAMKKPCFKSANRSRASSFPRQSSEP